MKTKTKTKMKSDSMSVKVNLINKLDNTATVVQKDRVLNLLKGFGLFQRRKYSALGAFTISATILPSILNIEDPFWKALYTFFFITSLAIFVIELVVLTWLRMSAQIIDEKKVIDELFNEDK